MADPITKVYDEDGKLVHDCSFAPCDVSWDGYVLSEGYVQEAPDPANPGATTSAPLKVGDRVQGAKDPGSRWDVSTPGIARLKPAGG